MFYSLNVQSSDGCNTHVFMFRNLVICCQVLTIYKSTKTKISFQWDKQNEKSGRISNVEYRQTLLIWNVNEFDCNINITQNYNKANALVRVLNCCDVFLFICFFLFRLNLSHFLRSNNIYSFILVLHPNPKR